MDFKFRCNVTNCRTELQHQAVVTTCSHIFCVQCASNSSLANSVGDARICPACKVQLLNKDDAVVTQLDPSEDYKTSVLSGFSPTLIMECASRALNFYNYQAVHETTYQEFLSRRLTQKVTGLNAQLDDTISNANGHIEKLQETLRAESQARIDHLQGQHMEIQNAFKQKAKALVEVTKKYEQLKGEKMAAQTMNAASDEAEQMVQHMAGNHFNTCAEAGNADDSGHTDISRMHSMQRLPLQGRYQSRSYSQQTGTASNAIFMTPPGQRQGLNLSGTPRASKVMTTDGPVPGFRQPLGNMSVNSFGRQANSAYGLSAGAKGGSRPIRAYAATPRIDRRAEATTLSFR